MRGLAEAKLTFFCEQGHQSSVMGPPSECLVTELCPALCDPMDCSLPGSPVQGILQARILE